MSEFESVSTLANCKPNHSIVIIKKEGYHPTYAVYISHTQTEVCVKKDPNRDPFTVLLNEVKVSRVEPLEIVIAMNTVMRLSRT